VSQRQQTGVRGEDLVAAHLERQGFEIVARNARVGRLELDVIAHRDGMLVFCEVRTRSRDSFLDPILTIDREKVRRLRTAAALWLRANQVFAEQLRFDAASVVLGSVGEPKLEYYESAF
jgi:putative endonuclease